MLALTPMLTALGPAALLLVMFLVAAESAVLIGFVLPGDSLLFTTGALGAAVVGDQVGYLVGRRWGPRLLAGRASRLPPPHHLERARDFFDRHGSYAVVLARFTPVVRCLAPAVASLSGMRRGRFTAFTVVGAVVWGAGVPLAGVLLGGVPFVAAHVELFLLGMIALSVLPAAVGLVLRRARDHRRPVVLPVAASTSSL